MKEDALKIVRQTIQEHGLIKKGDRIVVGVSGGPDSVCLLHILRRLLEEYESDLIAVHVNHMLRGEAADADQIYTEQLCGKIGVVCHSFRTDVRDLSRQWKMSEEEAGRKVRYDNFYHVAKIAGANKIAVAQNQNDQAETILMRLMRGTGTDGLAGIEYIRGGMVIRPLLDVPRAHVEAYCAQNGLTPRLDGSNEQPIYTRNKIRLKLIPFMQENFDKSIIRHLGQLSKIVQEDKDFIYNVVESVYEKCICGQGEICIPKTIFREQHPAIQKRMLLRGFAEIGLEQDIGTTHLENALKLVAEDKTSTSMDLPGMYRLSIAYKDILLQKPPVSSVNIGCEDSDDGVEEISLMMGGTVYSKGFQIKVKCDVSSEKPDIGKNADRKIFDLDKIQGTILLRKRKAGDVIAPSGMKGSKKLKEFLIDNKVPASDRDRLPLICAGHEVIWAVGIRTSERFKTDQNTRRHLIIEVQRENYPLSI